MHFVFISSLVPVAAPASGYDIANRVISDAIRLLGHKVSVIGFLQPGQEPAAVDETHLLGQLEVTNARVGKLQKALWLKDAIFYGEPVSVAKMHAATPSEIRAALDACGQIDGLILNSVQLPGAFLEMFRDLPSAFVAHNVEARSARDNAALASSKITQMLYARDARLLKHLEADLCRTANHVFTLAEADRVELDVASDERSTMLPLVTSIAPPESPSERKIVHDIGLIGSWSWTANRIGLDWFLDHVVPLLPSDYKIAIGGGMGGVLPDVPDNVKFLGRVPDAREFVRSCGVIPLVSQTGTGVQLKTIETFEMGLPAVATSNALRGIAEIPGNCEVADAPEAFAAALIEKVRTVRSGTSAHCDGRSFHAAQLEGLKQGLTRGLGQMFDGGKQAVSDNLTATTEEDSATQAGGAASMSIFGDDMNEAPKTLFRDILGISVVSLGWRQALEEVEKAIDGDGRQRIFNFLNANNANLAMRDNSYRLGLSKSFVFPDGFGVDIASRALHGSAFPANLNGTDFVPALLVHIERPLKIALVGAKPDVLARAHKNFQAATPWHQFHAVSDGYFDRNNCQHVLDKLKAIDPDITLVALGSPVQELWIDSNILPGHGRVVFGVGALFDFVSGEIQRAPTVIRKLRLEWAWRLVLEPSRLWRRYLVGNPLFLLHLLRYICKTDQEPSDQATT